MTRAEKLAEEYLMCITNSKQKLFSRDEVIKILARNYPEYVTDLEKEEDEE